jgi:hypothetical protein
VPEVKFVIDVVNAPVDDFAPSSVLSSEIVGVPTVFQQTPYADGFTDPNEVTFPFPVAVVVEIFETAPVVTVGAALTVIVSVVLAVP